MTSLTFSQELALSLYTSKESHPIDFDDAWQWLGYARKDVALKALKSNFEEGVDFSTKKRKTSSGGRPSDYISLTVECLKAFGMMAGTSQGKAIRKYFLECERLAKSTQQPKKAIAYYSDRVADIRKNLVKPKGQWCVIEKCNHLLLEVEKAGYPIDKFDLLDSSVGKRYAQYRREIGYSESTQSAHYQLPHCPHPVAIACYPSSELGIFSDWLEGIYEERHLNKYLQDKYGKLAKV